MSLTAAPSPALLIHNINNQNNNHSSNNISNNYRGVVVLSGMMSTPKHYPAPPVNRFTQMFDDDATDSSYESSEYSDDDAPVLPPPKFAPTLVKTSQPFGAPTAPAPAQVPPRNNNVVSSVPKTIHSRKQETDTYTTDDDIESSSSPPAAVAAPEETHIHASTNAIPNTSTNTSTNTTANTSTNTTTNTTANMSDIPSAIQVSEYGHFAATAVQAARQAGQIVRTHYAQRRTGDATGVAAEAAMTAVLQGAFHNHNIVARQTVGQDHVPVLSRVTPTWFLDGANGALPETPTALSPLTAVSIGLCVRGVPVVGVVYAPVTDELFVAAAGGGAYLCGTTNNNGAKLSTATTQVALRDASIGYEFGLGKEKYKMLNALGRILERGCYQTRSLGSVALDLAYVASGRLHGCYAGVVSSERWKPWDFCAGAVIAQEAGCVLEDVRPYGSDRSFDLYRGSILCAATSSLLTELRHCLSP